MDIRQIILISLQIISVLPKKYVSSSDESIENLLYYKDCQKNKDQEVTSPPSNRLVNPPQPKAMDCPYPKMCCALTCGGNECGNPTSPFLNNVEKMDQRFSKNSQTGHNEMHSPGTNPNFSPIKPISSPMQPAQPQALLRGRKKLKQPMRVQMQTPMGGRRDFGFTKDRIKSLINQDDDIRKILKDLVRVTMQKVDLVDMINTRRATVSEPHTTPRAFQKVHDDEYNNDDDDDLE